MSWNAAYNVVAKLIVIRPDAFNKDVNILRETVHACLHGSSRKDHINFTKLISCDHVAVSLY